MAILAITVPSFAEEGAVTLTTDYQADHRKRASLS
jgi:hypothetical protein